MYNGCALAITTSFSLFLAASPSVAISFFFFFFLFCSIITVVVISQLKKCAPGLYKIHLSGRSEFHISSTWLLAKLPVRLLYCLTAWLNMGRVSTNSYFWLSSRREWGKWVSKPVNGASKWRVRGEWAFTYGKFFFHLHSLHCPPPPSDSDPSLKA